MNRTAFLFVAAALALSGCKKHSPVDNPNGLGTSASDPSRTPGSPRDVGEAVGTMAYNFSRVQFGYNSDVLDATSKAALASNVEIMQKFPSITVEVQGHADERGTVDYNVALGQRRAEAIRTYMTAMGVAPARLKTVSYGEERPIATGHGEVAWAQNRRAEFRILSGADQSVRGTI